MADTPALVFPAEDVEQLAEQMLLCMQNNSIELYQNFVPEARARYDVARSAQMLIEFIENVLEAR